MNKFKSKILNVYYNVKAWAIVAVENFPRKPFGAIHDADVWVTKLELVSVDEAQKAGKGVG